MLHGGGNASVKAPWRTVTGGESAALFVKASGFDMATIEPAGHPALDLGALLRLRALDALDDDAMVNELRRALFDTRSPNPSIEALVHAFLPAAFVDHTHADAILTLTNQRDGLAIIQDAFWDSAVVIPYVEPGFPLAKAAAAAAASNSSARALVLMKHGLITWGPTARESYRSTSTWSRRPRRSPPPARGAAPRSPSQPAPLRPRGTAWPRSAPSCAGSSRAGPATRTGRGTASSCSRLSPTACWRCSSARAPGTRS